MVIFTGNNSPLFDIYQNEIFCSTKQQIINYFNFYKNSRYVYLLQFKLVLRESLHVLRADPIQVWVFIFTLPNCVCPVKFKIKKILTKLPPHYTQDFIIIYLKK